MTDKLDDNGSRYTCNAAFPAVRFVRLGGLRFRRCIIRQITGQTWQLRNTRDYTDPDDTWYFINDSTGWVVGRGALTGLLLLFGSVSKSAINFGDACYPGVQ